MYELRILRMDNVYSAVLTYISSAAKFWDFQNSPAADLRMSADHSDWITDGYGFLRMIRIIANAYGFLSVTFRSYRKWPCDLSIRNLFHIGCKNYKKILSKIKKNCWGGGNKGTRLLQVKFIKTKLCIFSYNSSRMGDDRNRENYFWISVELKGPN